MPDVINAVLTQKGSPAFNTGAVKARLEEQSLLLESDFDDHGEYWLLDSGWEQQTGATNCPQVLS